jgi:hypothetical protein
MAITPNAIIAYEVSDLQELTILDCSTLTSTSVMGDINGVRMLFSTVNSVAEQTAATTCQAWYEYEVLTGTAQVNSVAYAAGDLMLFANDETPTGTFTMQATGRYSQYISDILPIDGLPYVFTPTMTGRTAVNTSYFQDEVFILDYEQYGTIYTQSDALVAGTYLCVGSEGDSITVDGDNVIYVGETYTALNGETFSGTPNLVLYSGVTQIAFSTLYQSFIVYQAYLNAKAISTAPDWQLDSNLLAVGSLYATLDVACETTTGISTTDLQVSIDRILNYYAEQI